MNAVTDRLTRVAGRDVLTATLERKLANPETFRLNPVQALGCVPLSNGACCWLAAY
jgi:hypothetical protein